MNKSTEILISASQVTHEDYGDCFEFVLNQALRVIECVRVESAMQGTITPVPNPYDKLEGLLFELNHVRVNPKADNSHIISCLTQALNDIGVEIANAPNSQDMAMCFKPLGEISDNVRFYLTPSCEVIFLSPSTRPKLVSVNG